MLEIQDLTFHYHSHVILDRVALRIEKGEIAAIIGASGSGKSTLFKLMAGAHKIKDGKIAVDGTPLPKGQGQIAFMMQDDFLLPWRTVLKNITLFGELGRHDQDPDQLQEKAETLLEQMGLKEFGGHYPDQLSGGMRQRVSLARAFLQNKPVLLLDEPFASLDMRNREQLYAMLRHLQGNFLTTIVLITHDFEDAITIADRVFLLAEKKIRREWTISDQTRNDPNLRARMYLDMRQALIM
jgi:ABC-type nitrate/sulfonate/bicarbonate transport system ATPase subunit